MKEITDKESERIKKLIKEKAGADEKYATVMFGEKEEKVPLGVFYDMEKMFRHFEVDDIRDLKENYNTLSKEEHIPMRVIEWAIETAKKHSDSAALKNQKNHSEMFELNNLTRQNKLLVRHNWNSACLDSVYLTNFEEIKRKTFTAYNFDVLDIRGGMISALYVQNPYKKNEENIAKAIEADGSRPFDIKFMAMKETFEDWKTNKIVTLERKIQVLQIIDKRGRREEEEEPVPSDSVKVPSLYF